MFIWILPKYVVCVWVHTHIQELNMDFMQWPMKFFSTQKLSKIECQNIKKKSWIIGRLLLFWKSEDLDSI